MSDWQPMETAPKDGTPVWLCDELGDAGGPFAMRWNAALVNHLVAVTPGIWELEGGGLTWIDGDPEGSPTHWAPRTSDRCPTPPWETTH